jgi:hypothetical protein
VSPKTLTLVGAAVAVMAMGVYLFIQVKATPAQAHSTTTPSETGPTAPAPERTAEPKSPAVATAPPVRTAPEQPMPRATTASAEAQPVAVEDDQRANPKLDSMMELANKAYDAQDFEQATAIAGKVLAKDPANVRMLRVMVSANCIAGDAAVAQQHYERLPPADREQMKVRCDRYQVALKDPPQ